MSNAAVIASLSRELTAVSDGLSRVMSRVTDRTVNTEISAARSYLAEAQFKLAIAYNIGVDPAIEARP